MSALSKTVALVTGGCSGLGAGTVNNLLRHGARVCVADLQQVADNKFVSSWKAHGSGGSTSISEKCPIALRTGPAWTSTIMDVTDSDQITATLDHIEKVYGEPVNAVINCAGIAPAQKTLSKKGPHSFDLFSKTIMINLIGTFNVNRLAAERMANHKLEEDGLRGCIINTASIAAYEGQIGQTAYAASKGGIIGMTLPMARDLALYGIRVMTIAPGLFETPLLDGLSSEVKNQLGATVPCPNRLGQPDEFGQLVVSILQNKMLNGSVIRLDGGLRMPP